MTRRMRMSESASIVLTGEILPGHQKENVIPALARMFKTDEPRAALLVAGRETTVKRNVPVADAERYIQAFAKVGAVARVEAANASSFTPPQTTQSPQAQQPRQQAPQSPQSTQPPQSHQFPQPAKTAAPVSPAVDSTPKRQPMTASDLSIAPGWSKPDDDFRKDKEPATQGRATQRAEEIYGGSTANYGAYSEGVEHYCSPGVFGISTEGRIGRLRYLAYFWPTTGLIALSGMLMAIIIPAIGMKTISGGVILAGALLGILMLWLGLRAAALRLHDLNLSGKWMLLPIVLAGAAGGAGSTSLTMVASGLFWLMSLALVVMPGPDHDNDYGPPCVPNTTAVYVGAWAFVACWIFGTLGAFKYGSLAAQNSGRMSMPRATAPSGAQSAAQRDAKIRSMVDDMNAKTPIMLNPSIKLDKVEYTNNVLHYSATLMGRGISVSDEQRDAIRKSMIEMYCKKDAMMRASREANIAIEFTYRYLVTTWDYDSFTIRLTPENCN